MSIILLNLGEIWIGINQKNTSFPHPTLIISNCTGWTPHAIVIIFHINDTSLNIDLYKDANNSTNFPQTFSITIVREVFNSLQFTIYFRKRKKSEGREKMGIKGKMIGQTEIKAGGDVFHDVFKQRPHELSKMTPGKVQAFTLLEGQLGTVGSKICWHYTHGNKPLIILLINIYIYIHLQL